MRHESWVMSCLMVFLFAAPAHAQTMDMDHFANQVARSYLQNETPQVSTIERKQKSYGTALLLGWSPIPGDGLYYTGHPVQGALNLVLGGLGAVFLVVAAFGHCEGGGDNEICPGAQALALSTGVVMYGSAYLWDALKTASYAKEYKHRD